MYIFIYNKFLANIIKIIYIYKELIILLSLFYYFDIKLTNISFINFYKLHLYPLSVASKHDPNLEVKII